MVTNDITQRTNDTLSRRTFLARVWLAMGALAAGEVSYLGLRYFGSRKSDSVFGSVIDAGRPDEYPPGTITAFPAARFYLVRFEDGGFLAIYTKCTHLACVVSWEEDDARFNCPCHGSQFDQRGDVLNTPAPRPLDRFPITIDERKIEVNTGNPIRRDSVSTDDLTYFVADAE